MARMPLLAAAAAGGGRRCLVDLWATAPSGRNWQEPLGQGGIPPWSSWSLGTKEIVLFFASCGLVLVCIILYRLFCRNKEDEEQDTFWFFNGAWSNYDDGEGVSGPPLPPLHEQQPPENGYGHAPFRNNDEGDRPQWQQPPVVIAEAPAADVELALGEVHLTEVGVEWMLANMEPAADVGTTPVDDDEIVPAPEPAPTLKCTFRTADGWAAGTCSVCLSELVDGEKVRVQTACMHCFHATCLEKWLRRRGTCPLCRAPTMVPVAARRPQAPAEPNLSLA